MGFRSFIGHNVASIERVLGMAAAVVEVVVVGAVELVAKYIPAPMMTIRTTIRIAALEAEIAARPDIKRNARVMKISFRIDVNPNV